METQERMEREINLVDLIWTILFGWKQIICIGIIFAILISGMKFLSDTRSFNAKKNMDIEKEKDDLQKNELEQVQSAKELAIQIDNYQEYLDTATLMQIDPYKKNILELQYYVDSDYIINYTKDYKREYTEDITFMYCTYIKGGEMSKKVLELTGLSIDQKDFRELLTVGQYKATITITITYPEADKLQIIAESMKSLLSQKEEDYQQFGSHKLKLVNEFQNVIIDTSLIDKKYTIMNSITSLNTQLDKLKESMTPKQLYVFDEEITADLGYEIIKVEDTKPSFNIKYMILGAFVGVFLICVLLVCKTIFTIKLQNSEEIRSLFGVRLFGEIGVSMEKRGFLSVIDKMLLRLKNRRKKKLSIEQQIKIISDNIALYCKQRGIECIYMTGSEYENADTNVLNRLKKELSRQNIKVKEGKNISYDVVSLQSCIEVGEILFVEQIGKSIYDEIYNEINLVREQKGNILGVIVLD